MKNFNPKVLLIVILAFMLGWQFGHKDVSIKWAKYKPTISVVNKDVPKNSVAYGIPIRISSKISVAKTI